MKLKLLLGLTLMGIVFLTTGCSSRDVQAKNSGFLRSYDGFEEHDKLEGTRVRIMTDSDFSVYENIYIEPTIIITKIPKKDWTEEQIILFKKMTEYLNNGYKESIKKGTTYRLVEDKDTPNTLVFESAISAVEVHFDDMQWYQFTPIELGMTAIARAAYLDGAVRILGEAKFIDGKTGTILLSAMRLQKEQEVGTDANKLVFSDVKPALDTWIKVSESNLVKLRKEIHK